MSRIVVHPLDRPLTGSVPVPPDGTIAHRALILAALCEGTSEVRGFGGAEDTRTAAAALRAMGVGIEVEGTVLRVVGKGLFGLEAPRRPLACGSSRATLRLLSAILAGQPFESTLTCASAPSPRSMRDITAPLRARGARVEGTSDPRFPGDVFAPLVIGPLTDGVGLGELEYESPAPNGEVKSAVLLSGLYAHGTTWFKEPWLSPDHTERMMHAIGVPLRTLGTMVEIDPAGWDGVLPAFSLDVPGDPSASAFLVVAAQMFPGSRVTVRNVGTNPTRTGLFEIMRQMGAGLEVSPLGDRGGEPVGEVTAWPGDARGILVGGELVPRAEDDIPILCALAARARGTTTLRDAEGLRGEERDRLSAMARVLRSFGVACEELPDGLVIEGKGLDRPLEAAVVDSEGDGRIAMAATVLALGARAPSRIDDCDGIGASFPRFVGTVRALGARLDVEA